MQTPREERATPSAWPYFRPTECGICNGKTADEQRRAENNNEGVGGVRVDSLQEA